MEKNSTSENIKINLEYFPYKPYPSQINFIEKLTYTLMNKKAGIFESPTGTGKSLSLICGVLNFLEHSNANLTDNKTEDNNKLKANLQDEDWLSNFGKNEINKNSLNTIKEIEISHPSKRKLIQNNNINNKFKFSNPVNSSSEEDKMLIKNETLLLEKKQNKYQIKLSSLQKFKKKIQILYCTRTHSQISQIISEVKKIEKEYKAKTGEKLNFSCTSLGSRKLLCINKKVNNSYINSSITKLNEKCLELIQNTSNLCQYYNSDSVNSLSKEISRKVYDIEELFKLGEDISTCPYFSSRKAIEDSEMIVIPYNCILNNKIRQSLEIDIEDKIIIFDEAHNLMENILQTFNAEISIDEIILILLGLSLYYNKYCNRLKSSSNMYLRQLIKITEGFLKFLLAFDDKKKSHVLSLSEFIIEMDFTNLNIFTILNFIELAELQNKIKWTLETFIKENYPFMSDKNKCTEGEDVSKNETKIKLQQVIEKIFPLKKFFSDLNGNSQSKNFSEKFLEYKTINSIIIKYPDIMQNFSEFLNGLTYLNEDGKIVIERSRNANIFFNDNNNNKNFNYCMKYIMINANREFDNIIKSSKCVIFAGGTMRPIDEFKLLLKILKREQIEHFEGNHIIDKGNVFIANLCSDSNMGKIILNYDQLNKKSEETNFFILQTVKDHFEILRKMNIYNNNKSQGRGIVVFLSNYDNVEKIKKFNQKFEIFKDNSHDCLFFEEKDNSDTFTKYQHYILNKNLDSILFAVVGGRLSEGINFSDNLARIVLIFGLPYPNVTSTDLKLKMAYYDNLKEKEESSINGAEYYSNICMKAVNQSVGRSIRHINDYAAIIFVDHRYSNDNIRRKLPQWIINSNILSVNTTSEFEDYKIKIKRFFNKFES